MRNNFLFTSVPKQRTNPRLVPLQPHSRNEHNLYIYILKFIIVDYRHPSNNKSACNYASHSPLFFDFSSIPPLYITNAGRKRLNHPHGYPSFKLISTEYYGGAVQTLRKKLSLMAKVFDYDRPPTPGRPLYRNIDTGNGGRERQPRPWGAMLWIGSRSLN